MTLASHGVCDEIDWVFDGDGLWGDSVNWSSDPDLPGMDDDVTIDVGGISQREITIDSPSHQVNSLTVEEDLVIRRGGLTIASGGTINGALRILGAESYRAGFRLLGGELVASGETEIENAFIEALGPSVLSLPGLERLNIATDLDHTTIRALSHGTVNMTSLTEISGNGVTMFANGRGSHIDLPSVSTVSAVDGPAAFEHRLSAVDGGTIAAGNLATMINSEIEMTGGGRVFASNIMNFDGSSVINESGGVFELPIQSYHVGGNRRSKFTAGGERSHLIIGDLVDATLDDTAELEIKASGGGSISGRLTTITGGRSILSAGGEGSIITTALRSISGAADTADIFTRSTLAVNNGGEIRLGESLELENVYVFVDSTGILNSDAITTMNGGGFSIEGHSRTLQLTHADGASFSASNGTLIVPNIGEYRNTSESATISVDAAAMELNFTSITQVPDHEQQRSTVLNVFARDGGSIHMPRLTTIESPVSRISNPVNIRIAGRRSSFDAPLLESVADRRGDGSSSLVVVEGGAFTGSSSLEFAGFTIEVDDSSQYFVGQTILSRSLLRSNGWISGSVLNESGIVAPGLNGFGNFSLGTMRIDGIFEQGDFEQLTDGRTEIEVLYDRLGGDQNDLLDVSGHATLSGTLDVRLGGDFVLYEPRVILYAREGVTGRFENVELSTIGDNLFGSAVTYYEADTVLVQWALMGDANLDGQVDVSDWNIWNENLGSRTATWSEGDFTGDGVVNENDYSRWFANRFTSFDGGQLTTVPEPGFQLQLICLVAAALASSRRRR